MRDDEIVLVQGRYPEKRQQSKIKKKRNNEKENGCKIQHEISYLIWQFQNRKSTYELVRLGDSKGRKNPEENMKFKLSYFSKR